MARKLSNVEVLQDVAIKLYYSLHSSENENIISSLLTGSLNESKDFMKWFMDRAGLDKHYKPDRFYAEANVYLPTGLVGKTKRNYRRPDVFVVHKDAASGWEALKRDRGRQREWRSFIESDLRGVFVEVKHTDLDDDDREKYKRFNTHIGRMSEGHRIRFVVISSHTKRALEWLSDPEWTDLRRSLTPDAGASQHILLSEILCAVRLHKQRSDNILQVFETYLSLVLGVHHDSSVWARLWTDIIDDHSTCGAREFSRSLKREIVQSIEWLSQINGFSNGRWPRKDESIAKLKVIRLDRGENTVKSKPGGTPRRLEVEIDGVREPFVFELVQPSDAEAIAHAIMEISRLLSSKL